MAGGSGTRCGGALPKQFALLGGMPVLARTINAVAAALPGVEIVAVLPERHADFWKNLAARFEVAPAHDRHRRRRAVRFGAARDWAALRTDPELIAVQDGVRPLVSAELIRRVAEAAERYGAAIPVVEAVDSLREVEEQRTETEGIAASHVADRRRFRIVQTPQIFRADILRGAYGAEYRAEFTDDASVVEAAGHGVFLARGERGNLKITTAEDFILAEALLAAREEGAERE